MCSEIVNSFVQAWHDHPARLRRLTAAGRKCIGYFCTYTPVEILYAAGFIPVRITGGRGTVEKAYSLAPDFICPFMKRSLEKALAGEYDYLCGVIQSYTCDAACGMLNIWKENLKGTHYHLLSLPYNDNDGARTYLRLELKALMERLVVDTARISANALGQVVDLYDGIRQRISLLYAGRFKGRLPISAQELAYVVLAGQVLPPQDYHEQLERLIHSIDDKDVEQTGVPVLLSGSLVEEPEILGAVEAAGLRIVADDLCTGLRPYSPAFGRGEDPVDRIVDRLMARSPCPSRSKAIQRAAHLRTLVMKSGAKAVIFLVQKFCTPHLADIPILAEELKKMDIPILVLEMDEHWQSSGQFQGRLQSFLEMIVL